MIYIYIYPGLKQLASPISAMPLETAVKQSLEWMCLIEAFCQCVIRSDV